VRINPSTGVLELPELAVSLAPGLTLSSFRGLAVAERASLARDEPPRTQFSLPPFISQGLTFVVRVRFYEQFFMEAIIESARPLSSTSWGPTQHENWVEAAGGVPGAHDWGTASACHHPEHGMSSILVRYTQWDAA
jgi:hypothetical protein